MFICYEFKEAVATAKEIFNDIKFYGKSLRMFDEQDIENIHAEQELSVKRPYKTYNGLDGPPTKLRGYEEMPEHSYNHQQNFDHHLESSRSQEMYSRNVNYFPTHEFKNYFEPKVPKNDFNYRPDLVPNNQNQAAPSDFSYLSDRMSNSQQYRGDQSRRSDSSLNDNSFRNPYEKPVSRYDRKNSNRYEDFRSRNYDRPYDRRNYRNQGRSRSPSSEYSSRNQHGNQEKYLKYSYKNRRY